MILTSTHDWPTTYYYASSFFGIRRLALEIKISPQGNLICVVASYKQSQQFIIIVCVLESPVGTDRFVL